MAILKYNTGVTPFINEHTGYTFHANRSAQAANIGQPQSRKRDFRQWKRQHNLMQPIHNYRNLSTAEKNLWDAFAAALPQTCKNPDSGYLSGYQNFLKRQQYIFLNYGAEGEYMTNPSLVEISQNPCTYSFRSSGEELFIDYEFTNWLNDNIVSLYVSYPKSPGRLYQKTQTRYMGYIVNTQNFIPNYGRLYNGYCIDDAREFAPAGWEFPSYVDIWELGNYLETCFGRFTNSVGGYLKETGLTHWNSPNTGATNQVDFSAVGSGARSGDNGTFGTLNNAFNLWNKEIWSSSGVGSHRCTAIYYYTASIHTSTYGCSGTLYVYDDNTEGKSIRLINRNPSVSEGEYSTMTGNNGQIYTTRVINGIEWMLQNSIETKFRNNSDITLITDNNDWINATDSAYSDYNNNPDNSLIEANSLNITDLYAYNFGLIPEPGKHVLFKAVPMAIDNGQFFENFTSNEVIN